MSQLRNKNTLVYLISFAALLEVAMMTFLKKSFGPFVSPFFLLLGGLTVGIGCLLYFYKTTIVLPNLPPNNRQKAIGSIAFLVGFTSCVLLLAKEVIAFPIDYYDPKGSDVIPQIGIMVTRFLNGEFPYQWITEWTFNHHLYPTYLPMQWGPFTIAEIAGLDFRYFAFGIWSLSMLLFSLKITRWGLSNFQLAALTLLPFLFMTLFLLFDKEGIFKYAIETLISGYYIFLALSLLGPSNIAKGLSLVACLLSRYSVVLWVPLLFLVTLVREGWKSIWTLVIVLALGFIFIYAIPFLSQDPYIYINGYNYHTDGAIQAWKPMDWQAEGEPPFQIYKGLGFGAFFHKFYPGDLADKVNAYRLLHFLASSICVVVLALIFLRYRDHFDKRIFLLGSLKIYLVVFYNFIQIPFSYLFLVPVFVSIPILALIWSAKHLVPPSHP